MSFLTTTPLFRPIFRKGMAILLASAGIIATTNQASAISFVNNWNASVIGAANSAQIKAGILQAEAAFTTNFNNPATIYINIGWGESNGSTVTGNQAGTSSASLIGYLTLPKLVTLLSTFETIPPNQTGPNLIAFTRADAKALGLISTTSNVLDGAIGFSTTLNWDFNQTDGITSGAYDFVGVAEHEITEILGRATGIGVNGMGNYQMPLDLFRYSAPGVHSYTYSGTTAYFSLDDGKTSLGAFDTTLDGGDRADWLTGSVVGTPRDVQNAYLNGGATGLSPSDLSLLRSIGWAATPTGYSNGAGVTIGTLVAAAAVPEPATLAILMTGFAGIALTRRRRAGHSHAITAPQ